MGIRFLTVPVGLHLVTAIAGSGVLIHHPTGPGIGARLTFSLVSLKRARLLTTELNTPITIDQVVLDHCV